MFKNKNIFILGMARSGYEAAKVLAKRGNNIIINDSNSNQVKEHVEELQNLGVKVILGNNDVNLITKDIDYVVKNPGISDNNDIIKCAKELNIPVINEIEMCYRMLPDNITLIGITGSNGKTTTTMLTYEILKRGSKNVVLAGNMGYPLSTYIDDIKENDILLMEISVQQLCNFDKFKTNISVLTNIYDAHLDFLGNKENYINVKKRIFNHHTNSDYAIINYDNKVSVDNTNDILSHKEYFSITSNTNGCYIKNDSIYYKEEFIISLDDILLKGNHNYENIMASIMICKRLNISNEIIVNVLKEFTGVEHRIEFVREINNIRIYNDSKSTNIKATQIALSAFNNPVVLILGGLDRHNGYEELTSYMNNVKLVVCYGETKYKIKEYCDTLNKRCIVVDNLECATKEAFNNAISNDVVLLSPACASWDQFKDFEERGTLFKEYVNNL